MAHEPDPERLRALEARLSQVRAGPVKPEGTARNISQVEVAWRMVIELTSGILIGGGVGYGLDTLFGTKPVLLVVFILFGFAAGIRTVIGTARDLQARQMAAMDAQTKADRSARTEG
ncbi:MAG: AtpZ/AtpI family protein [Gemmobacter sp.]|jgi:ATP synthase protein I|nr:AtpZ/AtpI family protein [Gemmobacter sp.]